uniref:Shisa N-terminal domain-containing protein n=1 Tax=Scleropages formosus TaxID=113540 RepID=A0A8C9TFE3_SCLFO
MLNCFGEKCEINGYILLISVFCCSGDNHVHSSFFLKRTHNTQGACITACAVPCRALAGDVVRATPVNLCPSLFAADSCKSYTDDKNVYQPSRSCWGFQFCCGTCSNRYCCSDKFKELDDDAQEKWCVEKTRKTTPVVTSHTTTVINAPYPQQPVPTQVYQGAPYPSGYQPVPVPVQPAYGSQPMSTVPYPAQPYPSPGYPSQNPGPPPPYQEAGPGKPYPPAPLPYSQAGYSGGQPSYSLQPPTAPLAETTQPAYNPAYVEPPKTGY